MSGPRVRTRKRVSTIKAFEPEPTPQRMPVDGADRRDIRKALKLMRNGETQEGINALQHVVLGWVVPDKL